jgi:hypothetical protein
VLPDNRRVKTVPTPPEAAALRELGMLRSDELPMIAANWLVDRDTPALRRLAGLDESDAWLIDKVWADVTAELNVESVSTEAAWQLAMTHEIAAWRAGEKSTVDVLREVVRFYIDNGYPKWAREAAHLYGLEDELDGSWGRKPDDVLAEVGRTLDELERRIRTPA